MKLRTTQAVNLNLKMNAALENKGIWNVICVRSRFATSPNFFKQRHVDMPYRAYRILPKMEMNREGTY